MHHESSDTMNSQPVQETPVLTCKSELFRAIYKKHGFTGWSRYWKALQLYILAHSSLDELKEIVDLYVTESNLYLHNNLIVAILSSIEREGLEK